MIFGGCGCNWGCCLCNQPDLIQQQSCSAVFFIIVIERYSLLTIGCNFISIYTWHLAHGCVHSLSEPNLIIDVYIAGDLPISLDLRLVSSIFLIIIQFSIFSSFSGRQILQLFWSPKWRFFRLAIGLCHKYCITWIDLSKKLSYTTNIDHVTKLLPREVDCLANPSTGAINT